MGEPCYICCDLKSFYASVECVERGLDPMTTHLVVADPRRTDKTICLAVSPALKAYGVPGRARLFEVIQRVEQINQRRQLAAPGRVLTGKSWREPELRTDPRLALDYLVAPPRMALYIHWSARIYGIYLRYAPPEDIHVYSIDEVFLDAAPHLARLGLTGPELARTILLDILNETGITAAAGVGSNLYLAKVAMDITAKHIPPDPYGVRVAQLDEAGYRQQLWDHRPLTDFWRVGRGYARKLEANGLYTMGDIARCSLGGPERYHSQELLYRLFGVNAELLIDHAWGWEPCTIADVKAYQPQNRSMVSGQVLQNPYPFAQARLVAREMADALAMDLTGQGLVTDQLTLTVGYDGSALTRSASGQGYTGPVTCDFYGRKVPKHAHGTIGLARRCASSSVFVEAVGRLFDRIVQPSLPVRRLSLAACNLLEESAALFLQAPEQLTLFSHGSDRQERAQAAARERRLQQTVLDIRRRYGKNAILKGLNLEEGATGKERNEMIGGHQA